MLYREPDPNSKPAAVEDRPDRVEENQSVEGGEASGGKNCEFHTQLRSFLKERGLGLDELIYGGPHLVALEKEWLESFSEQKFAELGLSRYFPRMIRGLPRLYLSDDPSQSRLKKHFERLPSLKRLGSARAFFSLYGGVEIERGRKVALFTWVIGDGWGDLIAGWETARILSERFPNLEISWVALIPKGKKLPSLSGNFKAYWVSYAEAPADIPADALAALRSADCILQIPTYYPYTEELKGKIEQIEAPSPPPSWIEVGEYGFIESDAFHPESGRWSLGLHCLEQGILIHKSKPASFAELKNETLLVQLFGTSVPGPVEEEKYFRNHRLYLSYLTSAEGGFVYLQALLKAHERDESQIDLCTPDIGWLILCIQQNRLIELQGLREIEIHFAGQQYSAVVSSVGKKVRVLCPGSIDDGDFRTLMRLSGEFVAVRGNQSFSEAISANKVYFYDGRHHAHHFIRDLTALAENRIGAHRTALTIFRAMRKAFLHHLPKEDCTWVEESHFQEKESLVDLGLQVGLALQDPDSLAGFKKLGRLLAEEYSANDFLCHLLQREICLRRHPNNRSAETALWEEFCQGRMDFKTCYRSFSLEKKLFLWKMDSMNTEEARELRARLGEALRALIYLCNREHIRLKNDEIKQLAAAIGGSLVKESDVLHQQVKKLIEAEKLVSEIALHLEQETREM